MGTQQVINCQWIEAWAMPTKKPGFISQASMWILDA
jgi:hypothetical protein